VVRAVIAAIVIAVLAAPAASAPRFAALGEQRVLVIAATWGPQPFTRDEIEVTVRETDAFVRRASFGKAWLVTAVTPWLTVPGAGRGCNPQRVADDARAAAQSSGYDVGRFDRVAVVQPRGACPFGGIALGFDVLLNGRLHFKALAHELGHTWGLGHANARECNGAVCRFVEYGDRYDAMGWGLGEFGAYQKQLLGWVTRVAHPSDATATVADIAAVERASTLPHALVVRTARGQFWFEYRAERGTAAPWAPARGDLAPGVVVRTDAPRATSERYDDPLLIADAAAPGRPALAAGELYSVPGAFVLRVASTTRDAARLELWWTDRTAPTAPRATGSHGRVRWNEAADAGSGVEKYAVTVGKKTRVFGAGAREARIEGVDPNARARVVAIDRAGNRSSPAPLVRIPPGQTYDVGRYRLWISCRGSGRPTLLLDAGLANGSETWSSVFGDLSRLTRTCVYERAGIGLSDARPAAVAGTLSTVVDELGALTEVARVKKPFMLVGHSLGGVIGPMFAARFAATTAGLVLVDAPNPEQLASRGVVSAGPETLDVRDAALLRGVHFGTLPVVALLGVGRSSEVAAVSTNASVVNAHSGHYVQLERPRLVVEAARQVVAAVRIGAPLLPCAGAPWTSLGGSCTR
jgi:pimeloyl-ACP methyl ester carboxylesterase